MNISANFEKVKQARTDKVKMNFEETFFKRRDKKRTQQQTRRALRNVKNSLALSATL